MAGDGDVLRALAGGAWARKLNWPPQGPPTTSWDGVREVENGRVTKLWLLNKGLTGSIPKELGQLQKLQQLWLNGNQLTGSIPKELGNLTNLTELWLSGNQLSGEIPKELGNLTNLVGLYLNHNKLEGSIPPELGQLQNLKELHLDRNRLEGSIPSELGRLTKLTHLRLHNNQLSGTIPKELGQLQQLQTLNLWSNQLSGTIPEKLGELQNLQKLDLSSNKLEGSIPKELGNLTNLKYLILSNNLLTGSIPPALGKLNQLQELSLSSNKLSVFSREAARALRRHTCNFSLDGNPWNISAAIVTVGPGAVLDYYNSLWGCRGLLRESHLKVVLLGEPASGKTTVTRRLRGIKEPVPPDGRAYWQTVGVSMHRVVFQAYNRKQAMDVAIWDVGGQFSYYGFHHLLLTKSTVYLLIVDIRHLPGTAEDGDNPGWRRVDAWLDSVLQKTEGSAVVVVASHMDEVADQVESRLQALGHHVVNRVYPAGKPQARAEILGLVAANFASDSGLDGFSAPAQGIEFTYTNTYCDPGCVVQWKYGIEELLRLLELDSIEGFKANKGQHLPSSGACQVPRKWRRCLCVMEAYRDGGNQGDCALAADRIHEPLPSQRDEQVRRISVPWSEAACLWAKIAGPPWRRAAWCLWNVSGEAALKATLAAAMEFYEATGKVLITGERPSAAALPHGGGSAPAGGAATGPLSEDGCLLHLELLGLGELMRRLTDHLLPDKPLDQHLAWQRHHSDFVRFGFLDKRYLREYLWNSAYKCEDAPDDRNPTDLFSNGGRLPDAVFDGLLKAMINAEAIFSNPERTTAASTGAPLPVYEYVVASRLPLLCLSDADRLVTNITNPDDDYECFLQKLVYRRPLSTLSLSLMPRFFARCSRAMISDGGTVLWQRGGYFHCTDDASPSAEGGYTSAEVLVLEKHANSRTQDEVHSRAEPETQVHVYAKARSGRGRSCVGRYSGFLMGPSTQLQILIDMNCDPVRVFSGNQELRQLISAHEATTINFFDQTLRLLDVHWQELAKRLASSASIVALKSQLQGLDTRLQHLVGGLYPSCAVLLPDWDGVKGTTTPAGTPWWQEDHTRVSNAEKKWTAKPMRLVLICGRDCSLVPCGNEGRGYEVWVVRERANLFASAAECAVVCVGAGAAAAVPGAVAAVPSIVKAAEVVIEAVLKKFVEQAAAAAAGTAGSGIRGAQLVTLDQDIYHRIRHGNKGEAGCPYQPLEGDERDQLWRLIRILEEVHRNDRDFVSFSAVMEHDADNRAAPWVKK